MVSGKKRGRPSKQKPKKENQESPNESNKNEYENMRQERIKENLARMKQMGILELSKKLSDESHKPSQLKKSRGPVKKIQALPDSTRRSSSDESYKPSPLRKPRGSVKKIQALSVSTRRSSRLNTMMRVNYAEKEHSPKKSGRAAGNTEIHIKQGSEPEIYTAEQEKLLGDCKTKWALYVDGYDKNGKRIYDPIEGNGCHQCRQKTLGRRTQCSSCKTGQGQFCGDCLFTRYGENVVEVNKNPSWICPVCRGICNCSRCRLIKGWKPTGSIYRKVKRLGFKSVAHYLIQSQSGQKIQEEPAKENPDPQNGLLPTASVESEPTNGISNSQSNYTRSEEIEEDSDLGSINGGTYNQDGNIEDYDTNDYNEQK